MGEQLDISESLVSLIERSYGRAERSRYLSFEITKDHLEQAALFGEEILRRNDPVPGACAHLTALWTAMLRDALNLPVFCVAGDLFVMGRMTFGSADPHEVSTLCLSNNEWDGHCWLGIGQYVGDISVFRTAYAQPEGSNLRQTVLAQFGFKRSLFLMSWSDACAIGFKYHPKYVAKEMEISGLIKGSFEGKP